MTLLVRTLRGNVLYHSPPDGGWAWVVVASGLFVMAIVFSIARSLGVFYDDFMDTYGTTNSETSWILSTSMAMLGLAAPFGGMLMRKFGARKIMMLSGIFGCIGLFLSAFANHIWMNCLGIGVICGIGFSWSYICTVAQVNMYFKRWRGIANGIVVSGSSVGAMIMPILCQYLKSEYGWRGTMFILAGVGLNVCVCAALFRPISVISAEKMAKYRDLNYADKPTDINDIQAMTVSLEVLDYIQKAEEQVPMDPNNKSKIVGKFFEDYWLLMILGVAEFSMGLCTFIPMTFIVPYANDIGCEPAQAALLLSMGAIGDLVFRPATGAILSFFNSLEKHILFCLATAVFAQAALSALAIFAGNYPMLAVYAVLQGCLYGSTITLKTFSTVALLGVENIEKFLGPIFFISGAATLISPPIAGYLIDLYGTYRVAFWYAMAGSFLLFTLLTIAGIGVVKLGAVLPEHRRRRVEGT